MQAGGVEFLSHSHKQLNSAITNLHCSRNELITNYAESRVLLNQHGIEANLLVYNGNSGFSPECNEAAAMAGFKGGIVYSEPSNLQPLHFVQTLFQIWIILKYIDVEFLQLFQIKMMN